MKWAMVFSAFWFIMAGALLGLSQHEFPLFIGIGAVAGLIFVGILRVLSALAAGLQRRAAKTAVVFGEGLFWVASVVGILALLTGSWLAYVEAYPAFCIYGAGVAAFYWILGAAARRVLKPRWDLLINRKTAKVLGLTIPEKAVDHG